MKVYNNYFVYLLALISLILLIIIFKWINYLVLNNYIISNIENFTQQIIREGPKTNHTVNLPLTTTYSCTNFCGPTSRCSITGQQCFTDIDCPGCQPYVPPLPPSKINNVPGNNDAGKLTVGVTPTYSKLTTDIGTQSKIIYNNKDKKSPQANFGLDTWSNKFNFERKLFDNRYKPNKLTYMPSYMPKYTTTGIFIDEGPLASNAYLS
jgi:hypothetical protein